MLDLRPHWSRGWVRHTAWLELVFGLLLSGAIFYNVSAQVARDARVKFEAECAAIEQIIVMRLSSYADLLLGLSGFLHHAPSVTRAEFHDYVLELDLHNRHPGVIAVDFAQQLEGGAKQAFVQHVRMDGSVIPKGYPKFSIEPPGERASYHPMTYVEPLGAAIVLLGVDLLTCCAGAQETFAAMRDSGDLISDPDVVPGTNDFQWSLRLATYRRDLQTYTAEQRRRAMTGSVGLRFSLSRLLQTAVNSETAARTRVRLYSFPRQADAGAAFKQTEQSPLIDSLVLRPTTAGDAVPLSGDDEQLHLRTQRDFGGRILGIHFDARAKDFSTSYDRTLPYLIAALGVISTLLLFALIRSLLRTRKDLEGAVRERTNELSNAGDRMRSERDERIRLEREILTVAEEERARLGRELHDDLGQTLSATACLAQSLSHDLEKRWPEGAAQASKIEEHLSGTVDKARLLAQGLMPLASQVGSLSIALEQLARHARESFRIGCQVVCNPGQIVEDRALAQELYRIAQEAVLNAVKHGHATSVTIELSASGETRRLRMLVIDNGGGIDDERMLQSAGLGLRIMRRRCRSVGMDLSLERHPDGGTIVRVQ